MSGTEPRPRRRRRKIVLWLGAVVAAAALLVVFAPSLVNAGVGQGLLRRAVERRVNATVAFDRLDLSWRGPQIVDGFRLTGRDGATTARLDVEIGAGLLRLVGGRADALAVELAGEVAGVLRPDGSLSFADLLPQRGSAADRAPPAAPGVVGAAALRGVPAATVRLSGLTVRLVESGSTRALVLEDLDGELRYAPGVEVAAVLAGRTAGGSAPGRIDLDARIAGLVGAGGEVTPKGAAVQATLAIERVPVLLTERQAEVRALTVTAQSDDLSKALDVGVDGEAVIDGAGSGRITGRLSMERPLGTDGSFDPALDRITGTVTGQGVPAALLQPLLAVTPVVATRDLGPVVDFDASFPAATPRTVTLSVSADNLEMRFEGAVDPQTGALAGGSLRVAARVAPALAAALTGLSFSAPAAVEIEVEGLEVPEPAGAGALGGIAAAGTLAVTGPVAVALAAGEALATLDEARLEFETAALGEGATVRGTAQLDEATGEVDLALSRIVGAKGALAPAGIVAVGRLALAGVRPETAARLLGADLLATALAEPLDVAVSGRMEGGDLTATVSATGPGAADIVLSVPGFVEPMGVRGLEASVALATVGGARTTSLDGRAELRRRNRDQLLAHVQGSVAATRRDGAVRYSDARVAITDLTVPRLDAMRGSSLAGWLGNAGGAIVTLSPDRQAAIDAAFPNVNGRFVAGVADGIVTITAEQPKLVLGREAIQRRLSPEPEPGKPAPPPAVRVEADVPLSLTTRRLRVPEGLLTGGPFDPRAVDIDVELTGGPLVLVDPQQGRSSIDRVRVALSGKDLDQGLALSLTGDVRGPGGGRTGSIAVDGRLVGLMSGGALSTGSAALTLDAALTGIHSGVVDAIADFKGLLVAAVGPRLNATAKAANFSRTTGTLDARIETDHGWLAARGQGRDDALQISADEPLKAELEITPPLRERLLYKIHPLLADIRATEQPLRATLAAATLPLDGKPQQLNGDLEITLGAVEFDTGSVTLALLTAFKASNAAMIAGYIEPVKARIRGGVVTYDRFAVRIDKYTLLYSGSIDLNTRTVNLRTEMPLDGLAVSIKELQGYADRVVIPLVTRGRFGDLKTEIDPDFDIAKAAFDAGLGGFLKDATKDTGVPIEDIFNEIFKKKK